MYTLIAQNKYGEQLELTHNENYNVYDVEGFEPAEAEIIQTHFAGEDGSVFNSAYVNSRQIIISLSLNAPVEPNRINLYRFFQTKQPVRLFYRTETRNVYIDGYIKSMPIAFFSKKETIVITVICPRPYLNGAENNVQDYANINALFEFPFAIEETGIPFSELVTGLEKSIINNGDVETGVIITIRANGSVTTPKIYNVGTSEHIILNTVLQSGDLVTINTIKGQKEINVLRNGETINLIGSLEEGSSWFQLQPGDNIFTVDADALGENMQVTFNVTNLFSGV